MESTKKDSRTRIIIAVVAIVAALLIAGGAWYVLAGNKDTNKNAPDSGQVTEKQRLTQEIDEVSASIKQNQDNQNNAKAALEDPSKQIKVGR